MPANALVALPLILAAVLAVSGIAKVRDDDDAAQRSWADLGVPARLNTRLLRRAHPWAEIALALALVVAPGWSAVVAAGAAVVLCVVYLVLIARAAVRSEPVACDCFGSTARTVVTGRTVARNVVLLLLALGAVVQAIRGGSPIEVLATAPAATWGWVVAVGLAALTTYLVLPQAPGPESASAPEPLIDEAPDYIRTLTPRTTLADATGALHELVEMSARRAHLLLFVNAGCGSCSPVVDQVPVWQEQLPEVQIRLVVRHRLEDLAAVYPEWAEIALHDPEGLTARALHALGTPTAVLLGTDGMLAGGPVSGGTAVEELVRTVITEVSAGRSTPS